MLVILTLLTCIIAIAFQIKICNLKEKKLIRAQPFEKFFLINKKFNLIKNRFNII